jgi:hypothetical protein
MSKKKDEELKKAGETIRRATEIYDIKKYKDAVEAGDEEGAEKGADKLRAHLKDREKGK